MPQNPLTNPARLVALLSSLLVVLIWGSTFVIVKIGLEWVGPLSIAAFRYFLGALVLFPILWRRGIRASFSKINSRMWRTLIAIGLSAYVLGNGGLFIGLKFLPATTVSFLMSTTPILIMAAGALWLGEIPTRWQVLGALVTLLGTALFFAPGLERGEALGFVIVLVALVGFVLFSILGRSVASGDQLDTLSLTTLPLAIGGGIMLFIALPLEGLPVLTLRTVLLLSWLAVVNTSLGYFLYNHALRTLTAFEVNAILNLTPLATALIAWGFLGERLEALQWLGMGVMILGVMIVQRFAPPHD